MGKKIKVAIVGVGNCASALIQGIYYYQRNQGQGVSGLMFEDVGGTNLGILKWWLRGT